MDRNRFLKFTFIQQLNSFVILIVLADKYTGDHTSNDQHKHYRDDNSQTLTLLFSTGSGCTAFAMVTSSIVCFMSSLIILAMKPVSMIVAHCTRTSKKVLPFYARFNKNHMHRFYSHLSSGRLWSHRIFSRLCVNSITVVKIPVFSILDKKQADILSDIRSFGGRGGT